MAGKKPGLLKRFVKRLLVVAGLLILLVVGVHLWFAHNARSVLKQYISEQSGGKIELELSELNLNLLTKRLQIHQAEIISTDSLNEPITYRVTFNKLSLKVGSVWALLVRNKLLVDSLKIYDPVIQVFQWRKDTLGIRLRDELSIPQEMGKFYNSLIDALDEFAVRRIIIDNAKISLTNKIKPGSEPVTVSKIFFNLARTPYSKINNKNVFLKNSQTVQLQSFDQQITLPGGRHRLSFRSFNLELLRERIVLDSCTVTAIATDSVKSSYSIFFKKLALTGVDFESMSNRNVIKADSVYCEEPYFDIDLYRSDAVKKKTEIPDADKIIQDLTGNLNLAFVGVQNAGIHFNIYGKTKRSFFNTNKDNFEMHDFRINPDSAHPVSIRRFDMILKDYNLYNEDSTSVFSFDRLRFLNSKIILNNFTINTRSGRNKIRNKVAIRVPYFELRNLNWYALIFDQNLAAKEAILNNPDISYIRTKPPQTGKKIKLFDALKDLDTLVTLENVRVKNGQLNMQLGLATSFNVQNIDFNIYSNKVLHSTSKEGLRRAVDHLSFSKGVLRLKDITATLQKARFSSDNLVYAEKISVTGQGNKIAAIVNKVNLDNMQLDDDAETLEVDGFRWESAVVRLNALPAGKNGSNASSIIHLKNIAGNNTLFNFSNGSTAISTYIQSLNAISLLKKGNDMITVEGFMIQGNDLLIAGSGLQVNTDSYKVLSNEASSMSNVRVKQINGQDTLQIQSSAIKFKADLNDLIANNLHLKIVEATTPVIILNNWDTTKVARSASGNQSPVRIDTLTAIEPEITISTHRRDSVSIIRIPHSENSSVKASDIIISGEGTEIGSLQLSTNAAFYTKTTGEVIGIEKGKIDLDISDIRFDRKDDKLNWSGSINNLSLENDKGLSMGKTKNNARFNQASMGNLNLSSQFMPNFGELVKANVGAWLHIPQGQFTDSNKTIKWYNAHFTNSSRTLTLDSFVYHPTQPLDSVLANAPYELDYITFKTRGVTIAGLDVARYERDSSIIVNSIKIDAPVVTVYRDKLPPSSPNKREKPLPVNMIKKISLPLLIDSIQFEEGTIVYSEKNGKSRKQGDLLLSKVSGILTNIKNRDLQNNDSLSLLFKAKLMDAAPMVVNIKESYTDSLAGFFLSAKVAGVDLSILNPILMPLSNIKITSGTLDSMSFTAVGRDDVAFGEMDMHYKKFRIKLIKNGDPDQSTFLQHITSLLANTFIIRSKNTRRKGVIFYDRSRDQSFVNYLLKISLSGISTSLGVKKNRKFMKQYKQELKESNHPRVHLDLE